MANLKHQALNAMMNPHFITNSLYAISQMSIAKNNKVEQYVSNFSQLVRKNLEDAKHRNIPLDQELQKLQYYVEMEQTRLKNSFAFSIEVDPSVDPEEIEVPNMLLQPLVENAIWHGMPSDGKNGSIVLHITTKNMSTLEITLVDNGEGYANTNPEKSTQRSSFGLRLIREKLSLHHPENHFLIETLDDGNITGTKVTIVLRTL